MTRCEHRIAKRRTERASGVVPALVSLVWMGSAAAVGLLLLAAGPAHATALPFTSSLVIRIANLAPTVLLGSGTAIVNGSAGGAHIHSIALAGSTFAVTGGVQPITDPAAFPIAGVQLTAHNQAGSFTDGGGALGGVMPLGGVAKICLFGPCSSAVSNLDVPLSVIGKGGVVTVMGAVNVSVVGAPWTIGTAAVGTLTEMGFVHGPASGTSSTFAPGGALQLVTPAVIYTHVGALAVVPVFGFLSLHFVPEPATLTLLAAGIAALGAAGRAQRRR